MVFSVVGLLVMNHQPTEYIAIAHAGAPFKTCYLRWGLSFGRKREMA
jgi:hypothetical protein